MPIKNLFILTDLEGAAGVKEFVETAGYSPRHEKSKILLTEEVNSVIRGINRYDNTIKIYVWDGHGAGGLVPELLLPIAEYLPPKRHRIPNFFREHQIDVLRFVGQHAMMYTPN